MIKKLQEKNVSIALRSAYPIRKRKIFKRSCINVLTSLAVSTTVGLSILGFIWLCTGGHDARFIFTITVLKKPLFLTLSLLVLWVIWYPVYQYLYYKSYFYDLDNNNLYIKKGVATKRELTIPFSKITDVYLDQDLVDMMLGLYDLHVSTPTAESLKFAHIAGLNRQSALEIKERILARIHKGRVPLDSIHSQLEKKLKVKSIG